MDGVFETQLAMFDHLKELCALHALEFPFWLLRGAGQVIFLNNPLSGAFILVALVLLQLLAHFSESAAPLERTARNRLPPQERSGGFEGSLGRALLCELCLAMFYRALSGCQPE